MGYFRELPDLQYQSFLDHRTSSDEYVTVKNLFRRIKLRDDLQNVFTIFDKYQIKDGARPDTVAEEVYGSAELDWVVLMTANITRVRDQWPLSSRDIYRYAEEKYGELLNAVHHYETTEVLDSQGRLILPAGKVVDSDFSFVYLDSGKNYSNSLSRISYTKVSTEIATINSTLIKVKQTEIDTNIGDELVINGTYIPVTSSNNQEIVLSSPIPVNIPKGSTLIFKAKNNIIIEKNPVTSISNYEYEVKLNEDKRGIYLLKRGYLQQFLNDMRQIMTYTPSSQYVNDNLVKTENTKTTIL
jgi:hypothetical protein